MQERANNNIAPITAPEFTPCLDDELLTPSAFLLFLPLPSPSPSPSSSIISPLFSLAAEPLTTADVENTSLLAVPLDPEPAGDDRVDSALPTNDLLDDELAADDLPENVLTAEELISNVVLLLPDESSEPSSSVLVPVCILLLLLLPVVLVSEPPCTVPTSLLVPLLLFTSVNVTDIVDITVVTNGIVFTVLKVELPTVTSSVTAARLTVVSTIDVFVLTDTTVFVFGVFVVTEITVVGSTDTDVVVTVLLFVDTTVSVTLLVGAVDTLVTV
ncbi:hypothetical protein AYI69_g2295 [Smittium culicis]|uniref:Uncharacterized protein n=1 Tax=Smittium culicis TaxID=133412 RepID=A0A1R1YMX9_9FUNG|nr:hypothetical protein AYI69_g2295 [Smittium culicis]